MLHFTLDFSCSALHPTCYSLIPMLFDSEVFISSPLISLHLLDVGGNDEALHSIRMEAEDLSSPQLHEVTVHNELGDDIFHQAHFIIFLDDWQPGQEEEGQTEEVCPTVMTKVAKNYEHYGKIIDSRAQKTVRVIVAGNSFINLKCSLLIENAPSVDSGHFVAMGTQLEYEARAQIAKKLGVISAGITSHCPVFTIDLLLVILQLRFWCDAMIIFLLDVTDVIIWGNISGSFHVDLQRARVFRYEGAICGPSNFSQPLLEMTHDR